MDDTAATQPPVPDQPIEIRPWYRRLHYPLWSLLALVLGLTLYVYMEIKKPQISPEAAIHCPSSWDPKQLLKEDFTLTCTAKLTKGDAPAKVCWVSVYTCEDGREVKAVPCVQLDPEKVTTLTLTRSDFPGWEGCIATGIEVFLFNPESIEE